MIKKHFIYTIGLLFVVLFNTACGSPNTSKSGNNADVEKYKKAAEDEKKQKDDLKYKYDLLLQNQNNTSNNSQQVNNLNTQVSKLQSDLKTKNDEVEDFRTRLNTSWNENKSDREKASKTLNENLAPIREKLRKKEKEQRELKNELQTTKTELENTKKKLQENEQKLKGVENQSKDSINKASLLTTEKNTLNTKVIKLKEEKKKLTQKYNTLELEKSTLNNQVTKLEREKKTFEQTIQDLEQKVKILNTIKNLNAGTFDYSTKADINNMLSDKNTTPSDLTEIAKGFSKKSSNEIIKNYMNLSESSKTNFKEPLKKALKAKGLQDKEVEAIINPIISIYDDKFENLSDIQTASLIKQIASATNDENTKFLEKLTNSISELNDDNLTTIIETILKSKNSPSEVSSILAFGKSIEVGNKQLIRKFIEYNVKLPVFIDEDEKEAKQYDNLVKGSGILDEDTLNNEDNRNYLIKIVDNYIVSKAKNTQEKLAQKMLDSFKIEKDEDLSNIYNKYGAHYRNYILKYAYENKVNNKILGGLKNLLTNNNDVNKRLIHIAKENNNVAELLNNAETIGLKKEIIIADDFELTNLGDKFSLLEYVNWTKNPGLIEAYKKNFNDEEWQDRLLKIFKYQRLGDLDKVSADLSSHEFDDKKMEEMRKTFDITAGDFNDKFKDIILNGEITNIETNIKKIAVFLNEQALKNMATYLVDNLDTIVKNNETKEDKYYIKDKVKNIIPFLEKYLGDNAKLEKFKKKLEKLK